MAFLREFLKFALVIAAGVACWLVALAAEAGVVNRYEYVDKLVTDKLVIDPGEQVDVTYDYPPDVEGMPLGYEVGNCRRLDPTAPKVNAAFLSVLPLAGQDTGGGHIRLLITNRGPWPVTLCMRLPFVPRED